MLQVVPHMRGQVRTKALVLASVSCLHPRVKHGSHSAGRRLCDGLQGGGRIACGIDGVQSRRDAVAPAARGRTSGGSSAASVRPTTLLTPAAQATIAIAPVSIRVDGPAGICARSMLTSRSTVVSTHTSTTLPCCLSPIATASAQKILPAVLDTHVMQNTDCLVRQNQLLDRPIPSRVQCDMMALLQHAKKALNVLAHRLLQAVEHLLPVRGWLKMWRHKTSVAGVDPVLEVVG